MKQQIVEVPENEIVFALVGAERVAAGFNLEEDPAVEQQGKKLDPRKPLLPSNLGDRLRRYQRGEE